MQTDRTSHGHRAHIVHPAALENSDALRRNAETLADAGFDVELVCAAGTLSGDVVSGVSVRSLGPVRRTPTMGRAPSGAGFAVRATLGLLRRRFGRAPHVAQVDFSDSWMVLPALASRVVGARLIARMPEPVPERRAALDGGRLRRVSLAFASLGEWVTGALAHRVVVSTREMRDHLAGKGVEIHKIVVVVELPLPAPLPARGTGTSNEIELRRREARRDGLFRVVTRCARGDEAEMGDLFRAIASLRSRVPGIELSVVGPGAHTHDIGAFAREFKVEDQIRLVDASDTPPGIEAIGEADVGIIPARASAYSSLILRRELFEFAGLETPIVSSRLNAVQSYFPDDSLVFFAPGNIDELAERIYHVFSHPEESRKRALRAKEIYEAYTWDREGKKYLGVFAQVLGE